MASGVSISEFQRLKETVEVLAGMRGDKRMAALRMGTVADLQELIAGLKLSAGSLSTSLTHISDAVAAAEGTLVGTQQNISDLQGRVGQIDGSIDALARQVSGVSTTLTNLNRELDQAEQRIAAVSQQASDTASQLQQVRLSAGGVNIPAQQSGDVGGTPTASDFNHLVADVRAVLAALTQLKTAVD
ncbi:hypothetical protein PQA73_gp22 [Erwinia phage Pavtok]|uniref:Uncharacterized protein n=1 Tax=Erwinia phage Pavtok TaxID=2267655 RepID=A0A345BLX9_9CAUD|nr:hypothetical protein PQA73_gp22 [Erwinia phage Pavtok]AXF51450.1 hypothetical protein PAVTOK_22 [Erwinia phage Pavtok]